MNRLPEFLAQVRTRTEQALAQRLPTASLPPQNLHAAMRYAALGGGKRLRAALVFAVGDALGANTTVLEVPACALELIHAYSLAHDDLPAMDNDDLRRGQPSCHRVFGEAGAILAGDALQTLAFEILANDPGLAVSAGRRLAMITRLTLASGSLGMAGGQAIDLAAVGKPLTLTELADMHSRKTGALIAAAVHLGALCAENAKPELLVSLENYARALGLVFQIADDILDVAGDSATLGKIPGGDQKNAKPTYPALLGLEKARAEAQAQHALALESLRPLGDNGSLLAGIADLILDRTL